MTNIEFDREKETLTTYTAYLVSFIEDEIIRIEEERKGAYRRDGGITIQARIFLSTILQKERERIAEDVGKLEVKYSNENDYYVSGTKGNIKNKTIKEVLPIIKQEND